MGEFILIFISLQLIMATKCVSRKYCNHCCNAICGTDNCLIKGEY